jgi:hypothetical protein
VWALSQYLDGPETLSRWARNSVQMVSLKSAEKNIMLQIGPKTEKKEEKKEDYRKEGRKEGRLQTQVASSTVNLGIHFMR